MEREKQFTMYEKRNFTLYQDMYGGLLVLMERSFKETEKEIRQKITKEIEAGKKVTELKEQMSQLKRQQEKMKVLEENANSPDLKEHYKKMTDKKSADIFSFIFNSCMKGDFISNNLAMKEEFFKVLFFPHYLLFIVQELPKILKFAFYHEPSADCFINAMKCSISEEAGDTQEDQKRKYNDVKAAYERDYGSEILKLLEKLKEICDNNSCTEQFFNLMIDIWRFMEKIPLLVKDIKKESALKACKLIQDEQHDKEAADILNAQKSKKKKKKLGLKML
ncbi:hypothetical protein [Wolbachia endosymbiont of Pentidionis agamae]|uniref:hypothetical protein n=1 Tax=Wolbachia endosymbiont of Pentidionis agamae TaxID=3110435 RepID=UPI002FD4F4E3